MICNKCGSEFNGNFCPNCGTSVEFQKEIQVCPNCGAERVGDGRFCVNCGFNFDEVNNFQPNYENSVNSTDSNNDVDKPYQSNKLKSIIAKIYRFFVAGGMIFLGFISLLCLSAPVIIEELFGMTESVGSGFSFLGGGDDAPANIINSCRMLLIISLAGMAYGGYQLYLAFKKPYSMIKKYYLWAIDGVISFILLVLGAVVAGEAKGDGLVNGKLGSGFAMCIVMGVFGLIFLGLRIFYELKVFAYEDTAIDEERIAKAREKKERKPIDKEKVKKIAKRVGIPVAIIALLLTIIIPSVVWSQNIFRVGKVDKINIGDSKEDVIKVLGEPYEKNDYRYEYYSEDYIKLANKIKKELGYESKLAQLAKEDDWDIDLDDELGDMLEDFDKITKLEEQLMNLVYKYIKVDFDSDGKVSSVFYDTEKCESKEYKKVVKDYELKTKEILRYSATDIIYSVKLTDGSFYKGIALTDYITFSSSSVTVKWSDEWKSDYKGEISTKDNHNILYADYLNKDQSVYFEIDKNNRLKISGNGSVDSVIDTKNKLVNDIYIGSGIQKVDNSNFLKFINTVERIVVDEENENYKSEGNCIIEKETDVLILGCKNSVIPNYITNIGSDVFSGCISLTSITFGENSQLVSIGDSAFEGCSSLTSIEIPSSVTSIGSDVFSGCISLTSITFGENSQLVSIGDSAFEDCSSLTSIDIPSSVTSIGSFVFEGCGSLQYKEYNNGLYLGNKENPYMVLIKAKDTNITSCEINASTKIIYGRAFYNCTSLTSIEIPSSVTRIGDYAFYGCSSIITATIPTLAIRYIPKDKLEKVVINGGTYIDSRSFDGCSSLTSIEIPSSVTSIGSSVFYGCSNLTSITFVENSQLVSIGSYAFSGCSRLTGIEIPSSVTSIGSDAFQYCSSLTSIEIPSSLTSIGEYAFSWCSSLTSIEIPSSLTSIGEYAFYLCRSLTIYCEAESKPSGWDSNWNKLDYLNNRGIVVWNCKNNDVANDGNIYYVADNGMRYALKDGLARLVRQSESISGAIVIPREVMYKGKIYSVTSIGDGAFAGCSNLASIVIPSSVTSIGWQTFSGCSGLTIYCEAESQPSGWDSRWNFDNRPVEWGYKK